MRVKKPTLAQKKIIKAAGLDWNTWNVADEDNTSITLISKKSGRRKVLLKQIMRVLRYNTKAKCTGIPT